jgi:hypothetical protein
MSFVTSRRGKVGSSAFDRPERGRRDEHGVSAQPGDFPVDCAHCETVPLWFTPGRGSTEPIPDCVRAPDGQARAPSATMAYNFHTRAGAVGASVLCEGFLVCLVRYWRWTDKGYSRPSTSKYAATPSLNCRMDTSNTTTA